MRTPVFQGLPQEKKGLEGHGDKGNNCGEINKRIGNPEGRCRPDPRIQGQFCTKIRQNKIQYGQQGEIQDGYMSFQRFRKFLHQNIDGNKCMFFIQDADAEKNAVSKSDECDFFGGAE